MKCSGTTPCQQCSKKKTACVYALRKRRATQNAQSHPDERANATTSAQSSLPADFAPASYLPGPDTETTGNLISGNNAGDLHGARTGLTPSYRPDATDTLKDGDAVRYHADEALPLPLLDYSQAIFDTSDPPVDRSGQFGLEQSDATRSDPVSVGDHDIVDYESNWLPFDNGTLFEFDMEDIGLMDGPVDVQNFFDHDLSGYQIDLALQGSSLITAPEHSYPRDISLGSLHNTPSPCSEFGSSASGSNNLSPGVRKPRGSYYVDGEGARKSQMEVARSPQRCSKRGPPSPLEHSSTNPFHRLPQNSLCGSSQSPSNQAMEHPLVGPDVYQVLLSKTGIDATTAPSQDRPSTSEFHGISIEQLNSFASLYFENFDKLYPFLDRSLLGTTTWGWSLSLATAAIGARYSESEASMELSGKLHSVLHQLLSKDVS